MRKKNSIYRMTMLFAVLLLVNCLCGQAKANGASKKKEVEDNDSFQTANIIKSNESVKARMNSSDDKDYFKYKVDTTGCFKFEVENISGSTDVGYGWNWHVYDKDYHELCYCNYFKSKEDSFIYNFKKGTVLYIMVESNYKNSDVIDAAYMITAKVKSSKDWEVESNDTRKDATKLVNKNKKYGSIYISDDHDYYEYTVKDKGPFKFNFENESEADYCGYGWEFTVYDSNMNQLESLRTKGQIESQIYSFKKGTTLYVKVNSLYQDSGAANLKYSVSVKSKKDAKWEQESNDSYSEAEKILYKSVKYGTMLTGDDKDYYKYVPNSSKNVTLLFDIKDTRCGCGWNISVYNSAKKLVASSEGVKSAEKISWKTEKNETYYIVVSSQYRDDETVGVRYSLKIQ